MSSNVKENPKQLKETDEKLGGKRKDSNID